MNESRAREEICRIGRSLFERGYVHSVAGNISIRLADGGFLITPTDACLGFLDPARLARLDAERRHLGGDKPSKTIALHAAIYAVASQADPATSCVIHTHSTHCVALTLGVHDSELVPPITPYFVMKVGHVPVIPYHRPGSADAVREVVAVIGRHAAAGVPIRAVMLARLGPNVWHDTPAAAMGVLEELEETARLLCLSGNDVAPLDAAQLDDLRRTFKARW